MMQWVESTIDPSVVGQLAKDLTISSTLAHLLVQRGLKDKEKASQFLDPRLRDLGNPFDVGNMRLAVDRVRQCLSRQEKVLVFGDYDVDGITSTTVLVHFLRRWGCKVDYFIPNRIKEGYGLSREALDRALSDTSPDLLIAVDCGTNATDEVARLRSKGIDVIILDHHQSKGTLPEDCIIVNPHVFDSEDAPYRSLSAVGVVFKFTHAFLKLARKDGDNTSKEIDLKEYLDLVALGTVADLVDLVGDNRILVRHGLRRIQNCRRPGLCALLQTTGINLGEPITPFDLGFRVGPRINACGRLQDATKPIQLLLAEDWQASKEIAQELERQNKRRQDIEREISELAEKQVLENYLEDPALVLYDAEWHTGVVGIVASRISKKFNRPTVVLGSEGDDGLAKGSGRSIEGVNLVLHLQDCAHTLEQWGGHPMAVGISLQQEKLKDFRQSICQSMNDNLKNGVPEPTLDVSASFPMSNLSEDLLDEIEPLAPFGQGNQQPVFVILNAQIKSSTVVGGNHLRFTLDDDSGTGKTLEGIYWGGAEEQPPVRTPIKVAVKFQWNFWRGRRNPQLILIDWELASEDQHGN